MMTTTTTTTTMTLFDTTAAAWSPIRSIWGAKATRGQPKVRSPVWQDNEEPDSGLTVSLVKVEDGGTESGVTTRLLVMHHLRNGNSDSDEESTHSSSSSSSTAEAAAEVSSTPSFWTGLTCQMVCMKDRIWNEGTLCCVLSALISSAKASLVKGARELPIFEIVLARSSIAFFLTLALMYVSNIRYLCMETRTLPYLVGCGLTGSTAVLIFYFGLRNIPLADAQTVFFLNTAATAVMAYFLLGERLQMLQVLGLLASVAGVVLIAQPPMLFGDSGTWTSWQTGGRGSIMICLAIAALMSAASITTIRKLAGIENSIVIAMWFHVTALSICVPAVAVGWPEYPQWEISGYEWARLFGIGIAGFTAQLFFIRGIQLTSGATAACVFSLQVPLAYVWGILLFNEIPTTLSSAGSVTVVCGLLAVCMGSKSARKRPKSGDMHEIKNGDNAFGTKTLKKLACDETTVWPCDLVTVAGSQFTVVASEQYTRKIEETGLIKAGRRIESAIDDNLKHADLDAAIVKLIV